MQWARANGCPWNEDTCAMAAFGGHLASLQWARANGCGWNAAACEMVSHQEAESTPLNRLRIN
jgi:hypothetical protein